MLTGKIICGIYGEPKENHVSNGYCAGQPLNNKDMFPKGYKPTKFKASITKVVFRKYEEGDIIALFPEETETNYKVMSYMQLGQHGAADYQGVIAATKLATAAEYAELKTELESIGYKLVVLKKSKVRFK